MFIANAGQWMTMYNTAVLPGKIFADPMLPIPYRIQRMRKEIHDTFTVDLTPVNYASEFSFVAGQFNMLYVFGVGEVPISISGDPTRPQTLIHTIRSVGTVTRAMEKMKRGDVIGVRGPYGAPWPVESAEGNDVLIVAGGIGLAPLRPSIYQILAYREKYGRVILLYGARTPGDLLYVDELEKWRGKLDFDMDVYVTVDSTAGNWRGSVGFVTALIPRAQFDPNQTVVMMCGPEVMMRFTALELQKRGLAQENIYLSMERNMKCAIGFCGHCQFGPTFVCKDGPVYRYDLIQQWLAIREV
jgi:NAD(P)H-flavin reductase